MKPLWAVFLFAVALPVRAEDGDLPNSLAEEEHAPSVAVLEEIEAGQGQSRGASPSMFSLGPAVGYLHARGADRGTWLAGAQARVHLLPYLAAEGSITFHENRYENGDARVTQYPVQVSGLFYPIPDAQLSPYVVGGGGWYYSRITYVGSLSGLSNQTEHTFGAHAGAGLEIRLGTSTSIDADLRYIFLHPSSSAIRSEDFNYWQATAGLNLFF
jgi:Outer membrane protein beta-barrel domain